MGKIVDRYRKNFEKIANSFTSKQTYNQHLKIWGFLFFDFMKMVTPKSADTGAFPKFMRPKGVGSYAGAGQTAESGKLTESWESTVSASGMSFYNKSAYYSDVDEGRDSGYFFSHLSAVNQGERVTLKAFSPQVGMEFEKIFKDIVKVLKPYVSLLLSEIITSMAINKAKIREFPNYAYMSPNYSAFLVMAGDRLSEKYDLVKALYSSNHHGKDITSKQKESYLEDLFSIQVWKEYATANRDKKAKILKMEF